MLGLAVAELALCAALAADGTAACAGWRLDAPVVRAQWLDDGIAAFHDGPSCGSVRSMSDRNNRPQPKPATVGGAVRDELRWEWVQASAPIDEGMHKS